MPRCAGGQHRPESPDRGDPHDRRADDAVGQCDRKIRVQDDADLAAVSVATACTLPGSPVAELARLPARGLVVVEHPTGAADVLLELDDQGQAVRAGTLRTVFDGKVFAAPQD